MLKCYEITDVQLKRKHKKCNANKHWIFLTGILNIWIFDEC